MITKDLINKLRDEARKSPKGIVKFPLDDRYTLIIISDMEDTINRGTIKIESMYGLRAVTYTTLETSNDWIYEFIRMNCKEVEYKEKGFRLVNGKWEADINHTKIPVGFDDLGKMQYE